MITFRQAAWVSLFLHIAVGGALVITSRDWIQPKPSLLPKEKTRPIMVDFVRLGPRSAAPVLGTPSAGKGEAVTPPQKPKVPPKAADVHQERPKPIPVPKPTPRPAPKTAEAPKPKPVPPSKPLVPSPSKPKNPVPPKKSSPGGSVQASARKPPQANRAKVDLTKRPAAGSMDELMDKVHVPKASSGTGNGTNAAFAETYGDELTGTDLDLLNRHMKQFWNMPSGHEKAYDIVVEVELFIRRDGTIEKATLVDLARYRKDPEYRVAAESALRAVLDPDCSPLPLNPAKYDQWRHMIFVFDPREMCR